MPSLESLAVEAMRHALEQPHPTTIIEPERDEAQYEDVRAQVKERQRKEQRGRPMTWASKLYQRQIRWRAHYRRDVVGKMATTVAMTILPGGHAADFGSLLAPRMVAGKEIPRVPLVDIRIPRLVAAYRFPEGTDPHSGIAVVGYRMSVDRNGMIHYGGPGHAEFAKNAAINPHPKARAAALDPDRDAVLLKTTLALDWAMECAATGRIEVVDALRPPPVLFGFPTSYDPHPDLRVPALRARLRRAFSPGGPPLRAYVVEQGGKVLGITDLPGGRRAIHIEAPGGYLMQVYMPRWVVVQPGVIKGAELAPGTLVADLPRFEDPEVSVLGACDKYDDRFDTAWVARRLIKEATETVTVDDRVYDRRSKGFVVQPRTWQCVPAELVPNAGRRAVMRYLDFRGFLGRELPGQNEATRDRSVLHAADAKIQVAQIGRMPTSAYGLTQADPDGSWELDLSWLPDEYSWLRRQRDVSPV